MKAIIMAGGEGTRLRPVSAGIPKPMAGLFDRPVIEHIVRLLVRHDIKEIMITLRYMPEAIMDYLKDGSSLGAKISYSVEDTPLGTAGSVRRCTAFYGDEDFLVISGDAVCDVDIDGFAAFHMSRGSKVSMLLHKSERPLEFGLVMANEDGRIERFIEKPDWAQVFTDTVNTGIYMLSPEIMRLVPNAAPFDFAKDLFPAVMKKGESIYGLVTRGYWCDMGEPESYAQAHYDFLDGKYRLDVPARKISDGVYVQSPLSKDLKISGPCYIGDNVIISPDSIIGPYSVLCSGTQLNGGYVSGSIISGARIGKGTSVVQAIVCDGAEIGKRATLSDRCVIGPGVSVGDGAQICPDARIWPGSNIKADQVVYGVMNGSERERSSVFNDKGLILGRAGRDLTPEYCVKLGQAVALLGRGEAGIAYDGGQAARALAHAFSTGLNAAGRNSVLTDAHTAMSASYAGRMMGFFASAFFRQDKDQIKIFIYGKNGTFLTRGQIKQIENAMARKEFAILKGEEYGRERRVTGVFEAYGNAAAVTAMTLQNISYKRNDKSRRFLWTRAKEFPEIEITGERHSVEALKKAAVQVGYRITGRKKHGLTMNISDDGHRLTAIDESGRQLDEREMFLILCSLEFELGASVLAVPFDAPASLEDMAEHHGARILRLERDGDEADSLYSLLTYMYDGVFAGARICMALIKTQRTLKECRERLPSLAVAFREVEMGSLSGTVMRYIADKFEEEQKEYGEGLRIRLQSGSAHILPRWRQGLLRITGEAADMEAAKEICADIERRLPLQRKDEEKSNVQDTKPMI